MNLSPRYVTQELTLYYHSQANDPAGQRETLTLWRDIGTGRMASKDAMAHAYLLAVREIEGK